MEGMYAGLACFVLEGEFMKSMGVGGVVVVALLGSLSFGAVAQPRDKGRGWHGDIRHFESRDMHQWRAGSWRHGSHGGRLGWWWVAGGLWYFYPQPIYPYPDPYRPSTVIIEQAAPPPIVVQAPVPSVPEAPAVQVRPAAQLWYYCDAAKAYYPYVATCPTGWKSVPATPPGVSQ
jgi:hypothetical protein